MLSQNTELKFDLVSPVDELAKQLRMEFDFKHEARVMDAIGKTLQVSSLSSPRACHPLHVFAYLTHDVSLLSISNVKRLAVCMSALQL